MTAPGESFPRQLARTGSFTRGAPRSFRVAADGSRVVFLRSARDAEAGNGLWVLDTATGQERLVADPEVLLGGRHDDPPAEERARRERVREVGAGIVAYDADAACRTAVTTLGGHLFLIDLAGDGVAAPVELASTADVFDPRLAPSADLVAYVAGRDLRVVDRDGNDRPVATSDHPDVSWGSADFIAAEEMGRTRGHWWAPDGRRLAVARVDVGDVTRWHLADPADPSRAPTVLRYPAAGTPNARVGLAIADLDGQAQPVPVLWDTDRFPYLVEVRWSTEGLLVSVQTRDQRELQVLEVDPDTGATTCRLRQSDPVWVEIVPGTPAWLGSTLVTTVDDGDSRRLALDGVPVSRPGLEVRQVAHLEPATATDAGSVLVTASEDDPTVVDVYRIARDGRAERLTTGGGVHSLLAAGGDVTVIASASPDWFGARIDVHRDGHATVRIPSFAETPLVTPDLRFAVLTDRRLRAAVLFPTGWTGDEALPVLMDPYGGPHHQRVMRARSGFLTSQWIADQGFAVVVVDGRGTPGRGPAWERAVHGDLAAPVLADQVDALAELAAGDPRLDTTRVGIRGWSFGGYLAALAVLRRPDVFHAAVAGAPVTDWALYDTHYTERYLGHPAAAPDAYERTSLLTLAADLRRPLLLIHGLADDNVVVAHTLLLSRALLENGRPHRVLPLSGVSHFTRQEALTENLLRLQVDFLREALGA